MSDSKVYMFPESGYDRGHDAALWATLANRNNDSNPLTTAALLGGGGLNGMGNMWNNPLTY